MPTIEETIALIKRAHAGQFTKGGEPYWTHPIAVMELLGPASEDERHAALLHDILEDTDVSACELLELGYSMRTVELVKLLSRANGADRPTYLEWIRSIAASGDRSAMRIKLADNEHNMQPDRIAALPPAERTIVKRYERSAKILRAALQE